MATAPAFGLSLVWESNMVTQVRGERAIADFAERIGEWLLAQRFGSIRPVAYRWRLWEPSPEDPDDLPHVVIELTVEDPPAPPDDWRTLPWDQQVKLLLWPRADMDALDEALREHAATVPAPHGVKPGWPVEVTLLSHSEAKERRSASAE